MPESCEVAPDNVRRGCDTDWELEAATGDADRELEAAPDVPESCDTEGELAVELDKREVAVAAGIGAEVSA